MKKSDTKNTPLKLLASLFKGNYKHYVIVFFLMILGRGLATIWPYFLKEMVNGLTDSSQSINLKYLIIFFLSAYVISETCLRSSAYINIRPLIKSIKGLKLRLFNNLIQHSTHFISEQLSGNLSAKVDQVCSSVETLIEMILWVFFSIFINIIVTGYLLSKSSALIAAVFFSWFILYLFLLRKIVLIGSRRWQEAANKEAKTSGKMVDIIANILSVKIFSGSSKEHADFDKNLNESYSKIEKASFFSIHCYSFQELATTVLGILLLSSSYYLYQNGKLSGGEVAMVLSLFMLLKEKFHSLGSRSREFFKHYGKLKDGLKILSISPKIQDLPGAKDIFLEKASIEFHNVTFAYPSGAKVFDRLCFKICAGEKIGIVGKSGAGKSTLINLLLRLYELDSGLIKLNNMRIIDFKQDSLRKHISIVPQEPILFHRSIWDNIQFSNPKAKKEQIIQAIELANCAEFINRLPDKGDSIVGERGVKLSGGQRQRIAIARAILKDSPIIIFDEPTSALDFENEALIQNLFSQYFKKKTVVVFAHRLSTLSCLDRILVLQNGKIIREENAETFNYLIGNSVKLFT